MLFNSIEFALYFPIVCGLFFSAPLRFRVPILLVASCVFYMAFIPAYILILFTTIVVDYIAGIYIERASGRARKAWLVSSIVATCAILFLFKYYDFFIATFNGFASFLGLEMRAEYWRIILPIGLSFHTFQSLSYVIEVYRKNQKAEFSFITYATYVMFFPQLVAGPIERPQNLLHQFRDLQGFDHDRVVSGLKRMAWGFFKKLVIADRLALYVNDVYGSPQSYTGLQLCIATFFFAYQIYCDFSGYSDIAIGSARVMGFRLMENFNAPYHSLSVTEFWRRWHISLSTWFKDYVYFPLGGNRTRSVRWIFNIFATFGISGLWHGASWTFVFWGLLNGLYLVVGNLTKPYRDRVMAAVGLPDTSFSRRCIMWASTFLLTCFAWIFFRAESFAEALYIVSHLFIGWDFGRIATPNLLLRQLPIAIAAILILEFVQIYGYRFLRPGFLLRVPTLPRWAFYSAATVLVILFGVYRESQFIYFQF